MPRITADTVTEHVARQEQAVFDAAIALFVERGYAAVTLADIAAKVGLARNSLYRYFPDKASILLRWYRAEMPVQTTRSVALLAGDEPPATRILRWTYAQIDYAREPEHILLAALGQTATLLPPEALAELGQSHQQLMAPFRAALAEAGLTGAELEAAAELIWALVVAQAERELRIGDDPAGRRHLNTVISTLTTAPS